MRISEVSKITGLSVSNIRFYEKKGLLEPEREEENRYRDYNSKDIERLKLIMLYRKMDIPIEVITDLLQDKVKLDTVLLQQIDQLNERKAGIEGCILLCETVRKHEISNMEDIDTFLEYVKKEEEKGIQFGIVEQFLDTYSDSLQYGSYLGSIVSTNEKLWKRDHLFRCLWSAGHLLLPIILFIVLFIEGDKITLSRIIIPGILLLLLWPPAIKSYINREGYNV